MREVELSPEASRTLAAPGLVAVLDVHRAGRLTQHLIAAGPAAVVAAASEDPEPTVTVGSVDDLPRNVADLVDLGPRPDPAFTLSQPVVLPREVLDVATASGLSAEQLAELGEVFAAVYPPGALETLLGPDVCRWTLHVALGGVDSQVVADVLDAGAAGGLWALHPDGERSAVLATPIDPGSVWQLLAAAVLPVAEPA